MTTSVLPNGAREFIANNGGMALVPVIDENIVLEGNFGFSLTYKGRNPISDNFHLQISVPPAFPKMPPKVWELGGRIPKVSDFHINPDNSFCLGSPLRLLKILNNAPCLNNFSISCLEPYLYAVSHKLTNGGNFLFGELAHGPAGELADYCDLFTLKNTQQVLAAIRALATKKRIANKLPCPCGCMRRLGKCSLHLILSEFRKFKPRSGYAKTYAALGGI